MSLVKKKIDPSEFSDPRSAIELLNHAMANSVDVDVLKDDEVFAMVLTAPLPRNPMHIRAFFGNMGANATRAARDLKASNKFTVMAYVMPKNGKPAGHHCLQNIETVCNVAFGDAATVEEIDRRLKCFTEVVSPEDYYVDSDTKPPKTGDIIIVRMERTGDYNWNYKQATLVKIWQDAGVITISKEGCSNILKNRFDELPDMGTVGSSSPWSGGGSPGNPLSLASDASQCPGVSASNKAPSLTWQDLKVIVDSGALDKLYADISRGEGNINSVNRGLGGDTPGGGLSHGMPKKASRMTVNELFSYYHTVGSNASQIHKIYSRNGIHTAGMFQLIGGTFKSAIRWAKANGAPNIGNTKYNVETQKIFGAYLVFIKQPQLGNYLLDRGGNECYAGQALAGEWRSIPMQIKKGKCDRGYSMSCGSGDKAKKQTPEEVATLLAATKQMIISNSAIAGLLTP